MIKVVCDSCGKPVSEHGYNTITINYTVVDWVANRREPAKIEKQVCDECTPIVVEKINSIFLGDTK